MLGLISDFDHTLDDLPDHRYLVSLKTRSALKRWVGVGNKFIILTSRLLSSVDGSGKGPIVPTSDLAEVVICEEGGIWWFRKDNRYEVKAPKLPEEITQALLELRTEPDTATGPTPPPWIGLTCFGALATDHSTVTAFLEKLGYTVISEDNPLAVGPYDAVDAIAAKLEGIRKLHRDNLASRQIPIQGNEDRILQASFYESKAGDWHQYRWPGVNKTATAQLVKEYFGLDKVIATGDGPADTFLDVADISYAVRNAIPDLKRRASRVTEDPGGSGVVEALERASRPKTARFASRTPIEKQLDGFWNDKSAVTLRDRNDYQRLVDAFFLLNPTVEDQLITDEPSGDLSFPYRVVRMNAESHEVPSLALDRREANRWAKTHCEDAPGRLEVQRNMLQGRWLTTDTFQQISGQWNKRDRVAERGDLA